MPEPKTVAVEPNFAGLLRCARAEVTPRIPELSPHLDEDPTIVRRAIASVLIQRGVDPAAISESDYYKTERNCYSAFLIGQQRELALSGEGRDVRFKNFARAHTKQKLGKYSLARFGYDLQSTLEQSATAVEAKFTNGPDPEHSWLPLASARYSALGKAAVKASSNKWILGRQMMVPLVGVVRAIPTEGRKLKTALRTPALSSFVGIYLKFIGDKLKSPTDDKLAAARDLVHTLTAAAGMHFMNLIASVAKSRGFPPKGEVVRDPIDEGGKYRLVPPASAKQRKKHSYIRLKKLPNTTLKCPAHVDTDGSGSTNLDYFAFAAINEAAAQGVL